jgi:hypothetical protein
MLRTAGEIHGFALRSGDEKLGKLEDLYFDDRFWTVRYLVIDAGGWLVQRRTLISPRSLMEVDGLNETISTSLTKEQIEESPTPDEHATVDRQFEIAYNEYYAYSPYWIGDLAWGAYSAPRPPEDAAPLEERRSWDSHLFSAADFTRFGNYTVSATDGDVGHVSEVLVDDEDWVIRYLVVSTREWLPGKRVLLPPQWVKVDWEDSTLSVDLTRDTIKAAPAYDDGTEVTRDYEDELFRHYCRQSYWSDDSLCYEPPALRPPDER